MPGTQAMGADMLDGALWEAILDSDCFILRRFLAHKSLYFFEVYIHLDK